MNEKLTTSVVMATYNGEKYIIEQLKSLRDQTKLIDEVLIYDDGSQDKTADLIRKFIEKNKLDNWIFKVNEKNRGWRDNFMELLSAATKEIIFTCDQDDIWLPDKIEKMYQEMVIPSINNGLCGCIYTQISDIENEINGLYTYDRKICKVNQQRMSELARKLYSYYEKKSGLS